MNAALAFGLALSAAAGAWQGVEVAAGGGERGPWRQNESRYGYVDDPTVTLDARGEAAVAWVDQARKDVFFRTFGRESEAAGPAINVSRSSETFSWLPRMARAPHDARTIFVLWQEIVFSGGSHGGEILFARSDDGGASFSEPVNLSRSIAGDGKGRITRDLWHNGSLDVVAGADGAVYAAWTEYEGPLRLAVSIDAGRRFSDPIAVHRGTPARGPSLAIGPDRALYLAWTDGRIHVARSVDGGASFGAPLVLPAGEGYADAPKLAFDPHGVLHLVYAQGDRVLYARSSDGARSFAPARAIAGPAASFPSLDVDGAGALYVLWERGRRGLGLSVSRDGGGRFSSVEPVPHSVPAAGARNANLQGLLTDKLAVNQAGELAVVHASFDEGKRSRVWLVRK